MSERVATIRQLLEQAFSPSELQVEDDSARHAGHAGNREHGGGHFRVKIVADAFSGKSRIDRQRMVNEALKEMFSHDIHALSLQISSPADD